MNIRSASCEHMYIMQVMNIITRNQFFPTGYLWFRQVVNVCGVS